MKHIKLYENFSEEGNPNTITIAFNGQAGYDKFLQQYFPKEVGGYYTQMIYQEDNWPSLQGDGHPTIGKDGLEMKSGVFYPLFKIQTHHSTGGPHDWIFICYSKEGNEVLIIKTNEYANVGINISREITPKFGAKHPQGPKWDCKFDKIQAGQADHRGYFKIVSVNPQK